MKAVSKRRKIFGRAFESEEIRTAFFS